MPLTVATAMNARPTRKQTVRPAGHLVPERDSRSTPYAYSQAVRTRTTAASENGFACVNTTAGAKGGTPPPLARIRTLLPLTPCRLGLCEHPPARDPTRCPGTRATGLHDRGQ